LFQEQKWCCAQQTAKYYRHGVLPLPKMMTPWLDKFRQCQPGSSSSKQPAGWVFVSTRGVAYKPGWLLCVLPTVLNHAALRRMDQFRQDLVSEALPKWQGTQW